MNDWAEFRHFRYLLAIIEHNGFRAAAEHLRTAEPSLSLQAKQFQEMFGIRLFRRRRDGRIELTQTAIALKSIARELLDARDEAIAALIAVDRSQVQTLNLGCAPFVNPNLLELACQLHRKMVPTCMVRPTHGDSAELVEELLSGELDAALLPSPIRESRLQHEPIQSARLVACLRRDHLLAKKAALEPEDLQDNLRVLPHPQGQPFAHARLIELLGRVGVRLGKFSRASHPAQLQSLVKAGCGIALIEEGTGLDTELTTRPISGTDWKIETALVYRRERFLETIPVLVRHLKRHAVERRNTRKDVAAIHPDEESRSARGQA
jgi:DNA-binding transcriptional LysR family regulator